MIAIFRDALAKLGWVEDRNLRIDFRFGGGSLDQNSTNAAALVQLVPEVIVADTTVATRALQQRTQIIPIVITAAGDVVTTGTVKSLAHPEGNVTGITNLNGSVGGKWLELLKEAAPSVQRVSLVQSELNGVGPPFG
jgi:putative ABC transport system substrate-binding protein